MNLDVVFDAAAANDIVEAYLYYEELEDGLGVGLLDSISAAVEWLEQYPAMCPIVDLDVRRYLVRRFPFCLYYFLDGNTIVVIACLHASRHPNTWRGRIGSDSNT